MANIELLTVAALDWPNAVASVTNTPPGSPTLGDAYIVGTSPTGTWTGHANAVTRWDGAAWRYQTPTNGRLCHVNAISSFLKWDGSAWAAFTTGGRTFLPAESRHWWKIDNTITSPVATIPDIGRLFNGGTQSPGMSSPGAATAFDMTQPTGGARPTTGVGVNSKAYVKGNGSSQYMLFGGSGSDWDWACGQDEFTYAVVYDRPSLIAAAGSFFGNWDNTIPGGGGMVVFMNYVNGNNQEQGPQCILFKGASVVQRVTLGRHRGAPTAMIVRHRGPMTVGAGFAVQTDMLVDGRVVSESGNLADTSQITASYYAAGTASPLLFARFTGGGTPGVFGDMRLYDLHMDDTCWSDEKCQAFMKYANTNWSVAY